MRPVALLVAGVTIVLAMPVGMRAFPQQTPVFRSKVELVEVDVVVVDREGNPVHGLTRDDFVIRDRKTSQMIDAFDEVQRAHERPADAPPPLPPSTRVDVSSNQTVQADRLVVVVLDDLHTWKGRTDTVRQIATKLVNDLGPESSMALLQTGGEHGVEVTQDRSRLLAAIDKFTGRRPVRRPNPECNPVPHPRDAEQSDAPVDMGCDIQDFNADMGLYKTLEDAARILGGTDHRRKAFVLISENVAKDLTGLFQVSYAPDRNILDGSAYASGGVEALASIPVSRMSYYDNGLLQTMDAMRRGGVATYSIDPRGKVTSQDLMRECFPPPSLDDPCLGGAGGPPDWTAWVRQAQHGLEIMSRETGGFAVVNTDDFTSGIGRILTDLDNYYLLGFHPTDTTSKGYRKIDVEVKGHPEFTLRYRRGYMLNGERAAPRNSDPLAQLIDNPLPSTDLPMRLYATAMPYSDKEARVAVAMELSVPRASIQTDAQHLLDEVRFGFYAIDMKGGKVRERQGKGARIGLVPRAGLKQVPDTVTYELTSMLQLPPGQYQIRASATSDKLGSGGSVYLSIEVPDFSKAPLALTDLVLGYADGPHVPVASTDSPSSLTRANPLSIAGAGLRAAVPPAVNLLPFPPTLDRTFDRADTLRLYFRVLQKQPVDASATITALAPDGSVVLTTTRPLQAKGTDSVDQKLPLTQLASGEYRLQVTVTAGEQTTGREVAIAIR